MLHLTFMRISAIIFKEFKQLSRDKITFGMVVMIPLGQLLLFGYAINTVVRDIPVAVVDQSHSAPARIVTEAVKASRVVNVVEHFATPKQGEEALRLGKVRAVLIFPEDLPKRIARGEIIAQWLVDGSDTMVSSSIMALRNMPLAIGLSEVKISRATPTPTFEITLFFNPERRSAVNIVPGLTGVILTMTMILFTSVAIVRERERGNLELLITTPIKPLELMLGKIVPYILIGLIQISLVLSLGHIIFDVPINGQLFDIFFVALLFIIASLTLGLIISTIAQTQLQAMQMTVFILLPSILLSGFMFPYEGMPKVAQYIAEALPATHYMRMIRAVVLKGAEVQGLMYDMLWMIGFTLLGITIASKRFNKSLD